MSQRWVQNGGHEKCWAGGIASLYLLEGMILNVMGRALSA